MKSKELEYNFGDLVLVNFPFSDFTEYKKRPCLVLRENRSDVLVCFISSRIERKEDEDLILKKNKTNNLVKDSVLKIWKINTVHKSLLHRKLGRLSDRRKDEVKNYLLVKMKDL